ncbi:MAG: hypothetical protein IGR76_03385 [Synechococcales cyanobacterium T60_A2020_003]|nr:hypothetical protein [Synechococcales cyanobacterium T60_A2020_003]
MLKKLSVIPMALLATVAIAPTAMAGTTSTPINEPVVLRGTSGGSQESDCGFISNQPNEMLRVTEGLTSLVFTLESQGQPTLLITGPHGFNQCVMANELSGGVIEVPGVWEEGNYSLFIGDRAGQENRYTLTIAQE